MREYCDYLEEEDQRRTPSVLDIAERELLWRAIKTARSAKYRKGAKHPRWVAVMETFLLGSTYSWQLCVKFGFNPDEMVSR